MRVYETEMEMRARINKLTFKNDTGKRRLMLLKTEMRKVLAGTMIEVNVTEDRVFREGEFSAQEARQVVELEALNGKGVWWPLVDVVKKAMRGKGDWTVTYFKCRVKG